MNINAAFAEQVQVCQGILPVDLASGANAGDWLNMANYAVCTFIMFADPGTAAQDPVLTINQASDASGTGAKDLLFTDIWEKEAATSLLSTAQYTRQTQTAATSYTSATGGENAQLIIIDVRAEQLDVENGFNFVQLSIADTGATAGKLGCVLACLWGSRYQGGSLPSAIA